MSQLEICHFGSFQYLKDSKYHLNNVKSNNTHSITAEIDSLTPKTYKKTYYKPYQILCSRFCGKFHDFLTRFRKMAIN